MRNRRQLLWKGVSLNAKEEGIASLLLTTWPFTALPRLLSHWRAWLEWKSKTKSSRGFASLVSICWSPWRVKWLSQKVQLTLGRIINVRKDGEQTSMRSSKRNISVGPQEITKEKSAKNKTGILNNNLDITILQ